MMSESVDREQLGFAFREGDMALLIDRKQRRHLIELDASKTYYTHTGAVTHSDIIGREDGCRIRTSGGQSMLIVRPTLGDFVLEMPRIAQVVYPKDIGAIVVYGDIYPGARVLEAGTGSGALTMALLRAVGETGRVYTYEIRLEMAERAKKNISAMNLALSNLTMKAGDVYQGFEERDLDRIVLDLPEPWYVVPHAAVGLRPGGIFVTFLPTILQVHQLTECIFAQHVFDLVETFEVLVRTWSVTSQSVRPDHRMVAHTGFITTARKCSPPGHAEATT